MIDQIGDVKLYEGTQISAQMDVMIVPTFSCCNERYVKKALVSFQWKPDQRPDCNQMNTSNGCRYRRLSISDHSLYDMTQQLGGNSHLQKSIGDSDLQTGNYKSGWQFGCRPPPLRFKYCAVSQVSEEAPGAGIFYYFEGCDDLECQTMTTGSGGQGKVLVGKRNEDGKVPMKPGHISTVTGTMTWVDKYTGNIKN